MDKGRGGTNLQKTEARPGEGNAWTRFSKLTKKRASNPGGDEHARSWGCPYVQKRDMQSSWGFLELQRGEPQRSGQAGHMNSQTWNLKLGEEDEEGRRPKSQLRGCLGLGKRLVMKSGHGQSFPHRPQPPPHPIPYFWSPQSSGSELTRCSISPSGWQWLDTLCLPKIFLNISVPTHPALVSVCIHSALVEGAPRLALGPGWRAIYLSALHPPYPLAWGGPSPTLFGRQTGKLRCQIEKILVHSCQTEPGWVLVFLS